MFGRWSWVKIIDAEAARRGCAAVQAIRVPKKMQTKNSKFYAEKSFFAFFFSRRKEGEGGFS